MKNIEIFKEVISKKLLELCKKILGVVRDKNNWLKMNEFGLEYVDVV